MSLITRVVVFNMEKVRTKVMGEEGGVVVEEFVSEGVVW